MRELIVLGCLFVSLQPLFAQSDVKSWTRFSGSSGDDLAYAVAVDSSGNAVIAGATQGSIAGGNAGRYDMFVAKYNSAGTRLWVKQRGSDQREFAYGVAVDPSGNIYTTGYTGGDFDGGIHSGDNTYFDVYVSKFDSAGTWQWCRQFGFNSNDEGRAVACDRFGNIYVTGYVRGALDGLPRPGLADVFIRKYDAAGNKIWTALFGSPEVDESFGITCDNTGNVFVTGWCDGVIDGVTTNHGNGDNFLAKYNSDGQQLWIKQWGTGNKDTGYGLATDATGNVFVSGYSTGPLYGDPNVGNRDLFLAKFDSAGNPLWGFTVGTSGHDQAWGAATDPTGNIYITGESGGPLNEGSYTGDLDIFLSKYDTSGNHLWTSQYGTTDLDLARGIAVATNGTVYIAGYAGGNLDGIANPGPLEPFIMKFIPSTNFPPGTPIARSATGATSNSFTANWSTASKAISYRLDVSSVADFSSYLPGYQNLNVGNVTNKFIGGLTPLATYFYRVRAYNTNGISTNSGTISVTMSPVTPCNYLANPDFESGFSFIGGGTVAANWKEWEASPGVTVGYDEQVIVHGGSHSQRIRVSSTNATSGGVYQRIPAINGFPYTVSVWIYAGDSQSACSLGVDPTGGTNANGAGVVWSSATTNVAWVQQTWTGTTTANLLTVFFKVESSDNIKRNGYFDDATPNGGVPPMLSVQNSRSSMTLSWPQCPAAHLEQTENLIEPAIWTSSTNQVNNTGSEKTVTLSPSGSSAFFRLVQE